MNLLQLIAILVPPKNIKILLDFNTILKKPLKRIINSHAFSIVTIDIKQGCHSEEILSQCKNSNCRGNSILDSMKHPEPVNFNNFNKKCNGCVNETPINGLTINLRNLHQDNTGYKRGSGSIWKFIHKNAKDMKYLVSGLHFSVTVHIAHYNKRIGGKYESDFSDYLRKYNPEYKSNLFCLYVVLLRAVKHLDYTIFNCIDTKNSDINISYLQNFIIAFKKIKLLDVTTPYNHNYFSVVDLYLDCIECGTCRLWGKIQFYGLEAALRVLSGKKISSRDAFFIFHLLKKVSDSIEFINKMQTI